MTATEYRADALTRLTDIELVEQAYAAVNRVADTNEELCDELHFLIAEAFERFASDIELESRVRINEDGPAGLVYAVQKMAERHAARLTAKAEAF